MYGLLVADSIGKNRGRGLEGERRRRGISPAVPAVMIVLVILAAGLFVYFEFVPSTSPPNPQPFIALSFPSSTSGEAGLEFVSFTVKNTGQVPVVLGAGLGTLPSISNSTTACNGRAEGLLYYAAFTLNDTPAYLPLPADAFIEPPNSTWEEAPIGAVVTEPGIYQVAITAIDSTSINE